MSPLDRLPYWRNLNNTTKALASAIGLVLVLGFFQPTRRYAIWAGVVIVILWSLKLAKKHGAT